MRATVLPITGGCPAGSSPWGFAMGAPPPIIGALPASDSSSFWSWSSVSLTPRAPTDTLGIPPMTSPLRWVIGSPSLSTRTESETSPSKAPVGIIMSRALSVNGIGNDPADNRLTATSVPRALGLSAIRRATRKIVSVGATSPLRAGASTIVPLMAALGSTGASGAGGASGAAEGGGCGAGGGVGSGAAAAEFAAIAGMPDGLSASSFFSHDASARAPSAATTQTRARRGHNAAGGLPSAETSTLGYHHSPMSTPGPLVTELATRTLIAPGIADLSFKMVSPAELSFRAGQFVSIAVDGPDAPSPSTKKLLDRLAERRRRHAALHHPGHPSGAASELLMSTPIGGAMRMTGPHGFFVLDQEHAGDVVFGATGTGVAAVMPMLGELGRAADRGRRYLYWGLRHETDLFAHEEIARLCERSGTELRIYLSAAQENDAGAALAGASRRRSWPSSRA